MRKDSQRHHHLHYAQSNLAKVKLYGVQICISIFQNLEDESDQFKVTDPSQIESLLSKWLQALHPNHYLVLKLKKRLLDVLSLESEIGDEEDRKKIERQVRLGTDLLRVVEVLEPGCSLNRGRILRQLHLPTLKLAKIRLKAGEISKGEFLAVTKEAIKNMKEAVKCMEDFGTDKAMIASNGDIFE